MILQHSNLLLIFATLFCVTLAAEFTDLEESSSPNWKLYCEIAGTVVFVMVLLACAYWVDCSGIVEWCCSEKETAVEPLLSHSEEETLYSLGSDKIKIKVNIGQF